MLNEEEFVAEVLKALPTTVSVVSLDTRLDQLPSDKVSRAAILAGLSRLMGGPPNELLSSIVTLDEAFQWYRARYEAEPAIPHVANVRLRPVRDSDYPALYEASTRPESAFRWKYRGATPSPQQFSSQLFDGVLAQFMVEDREGTAHGLVCCYNAHADGKFAYIAFIRTGPTNGRGEMVEGVMLFIKYLFDGWDFRKLYAEVPEYNADGMFSVESRAVRLEGRLVEHLFHDGRWWDQLIISLWRADWSIEVEAWHLDGSMDRSDT